MSLRFRKSIALAAYLAAVAALLLPYPASVMISVLCVYIAVNATRWQREHFRFSLRGLFGLVFVAAVLCLFINWFHKMEEMIERDDRETHRDALIEFRNRTP